MSFSLLSMKPTPIQRKPAILEPTPIRREPAKLKPFSPTILKAARKSDERQRKTFDDFIKTAQHKHPISGFDAGVDPKKLEPLCKFYHNQQQIGIPTYHESYYDFGQVVAGRKQGKWIITTYTITPGGMIPMITPSSSGQDLVTVRIDLESGTVRSL